MKLPSMTGVAIAAGITLMTIYLVNRFSTGGVSGLGAKKAA